MGRRSTRENKNIYQLSREAAGLTREAAAERLQFISADRIEKIESERSLPHQDEIIPMADCYKAPALCNHYCSEQCPIGQRYMPKVELKSLSQLTVEILASLNALTREKDRLIEITVDGTITSDELSDFNKIQSTLNDMEITIRSLKLWAENAAHSDVQE